ncbi:uncharacterized protein LACBIDRAFT_328169 [Laccaria bicolor S238N-H82]|uniref:Predicted protein n=1 Tax=Laccaria bicolor (strain S238N-H82 / ATCC MYA-4686) TaxID=486041 RepID=B0DDY7_LACBS|nr:uncharacterized protein LACBIDRAFT_328169 [Laccaria bicolor S238N-H82]EDR07299.1 predicted protein [Laccaria bicolor S238N-H82]|eukprot:XP_001882230.1 predicted protein [Laccaria bicolor S238N-H82]
MQNYGYLVVSQWREVFIFEQSLIQCLNVRERPDAEHDSFKIEETFVAKWARRTSDEAIRPDTAANCTRIWLNLEIGFTERGVALCWSEYEPERTRIDTQHWGSPELEGLPVVHALDGGKGEQFVELQNILRALAARFWLPAETSMSTLPGHNHTSSSLDGRGDADSASRDGKSMEKTVPNYGAFESIHPLYHNDRFIGRIPSKSFAPPHTVASIKWSVCKLEGLQSEPDKALLFTQLSSPKPKEESARLSLFAPSGPGRSEQDPIVLVVESEKRTKEVSHLIDDSYPNRALMSFAVHYRVYSSKGGDQKAKTSFDQTDISLGRINTLFIAPPHTAGSLKARIAQVEGLITPGHALYKDMELFQDTDSDAAMNDTDIISFQGDNYPGGDEGDPVALVNATTNTAADQKTKPTSKPTPDTAATHRALSDGPDSQFTKPAQLTDTYGYMVINSKGEKGCGYGFSLAVVLKGNLAFD